MFYLTTAVGNLFFDPVESGVSILLTNIRRGMVFKLLLYLGICSVGLEGKL